MTTKINKIKGLVYGGLIGDAMGVQFEFLPTEQVKIPSKLTYENSPFLNIEHGRWSDDGDNIILLLQTMTECNNSKIKFHMLYAKKLKFWANNGICELGDKTSIGCGNTVYTTVCDKIFEKDPHKAAFNTYQKRKSNSNGAIMKIAPLGMLSDEQEIITNTINVSKVTHYSTLSQAACLSITLLIHYIITERFNPFDSNETLKIIDHIINKVFKNVESLTLYEKQEFVKYIRVKKLDDLDLNEEFNVTYCLKTLGTAFWALCNIHKSYKYLMKNIYSKGGDTDTNGAVAGAIVGCCKGYTGLPENWLKNLKYKEYIEKQIKKFIY
uniref:ADP-ribosylglycohydrolase n=1 Tax=Mimivirus LCMiAC02 TaxID=2506609 RepID=A0A481Z1C6_9VIRU|nr:MAG: ADP-ribosylglycohydrolase [Mimivirus LCMiAC02]